MRLIEKKIVDKMKHIPMNNFKTWHLSERDKVYRAGNVVYYKLHGTVVAKRHDDGRLQFYTQGWTTNTTKSRINAILDGFNINLRVFQEDFQWYWYETRGEMKKQEYSEFDIISKLPDGKVTITQGNWETFIEVKNRGE